MIHPDMNGLCFFCGGRTQGFTHKDRHGATRYEALGCRACNRPVCSSCARLVERSEHGMVEVFKLCPTCQESHPDLDTPGKLAAIHVDTRYCNICQTSAGDGTAPPTWVFCGDEDCGLLICPTCRRRLPGGEVRCPLCFDSMKIRPVKCRECDKKLDIRSQDSWFECRRCRQVFCGSHRSSSDPRRLDSQICAGCAATPRE